MDKKDLLVATGAAGGMFFPLIGKPARFAKIPLKMAVWFPDGQQIAACGEHGKIYIFDNKGTCVEKIEDLEDAPITSLCVALKGKQVIYSSGSTVKIWDKTAKKISNEFKIGKDHVTSISSNVTSTHVAVGTNTGRIAIWNTVQSTSSELISSSSSQEITMLLYSPLRRGHLVAASADGSILLWDTLVSEKPYHVFQGVHLGPATGLAFSPIRKDLLASCGLDKKLLLLDIDLKSVQKSISYESPLSTVTFKHDGTTLAVGSMQGKIFVSNLKDNSAKTFVEFEPSQITSLAFPTEPKVQSSPSTRPSAQSSASTTKPTQTAAPGPSSRPAAQSTRPALPSETPMKTPVSKTAGSNPDDLFSPLRDPGPEDTPATENPMRTLNFDPSAGVSPLPVASSSSSSRTIATNLAETSTSTFSLNSDKASLISERDRGKEREKPAPAPPAFPTKALPPQDPLPPKRVEFSGELGEVFSPMTGQPQTPGSAVSFNPSRVTAYKSPITPSGKPPSAKAEAKPPLYQQPQPSALHQQPSLHQQPPQHQPQPLRPIFQQSLPSSQPQLQPQPKSTSFSEPPPLKSQTSSTSLKGSTALAEPPRLESGSSVKPPQFTTSSSSSSLLTSAHLSTGGERSGLVRDKADQIATRLATELESTSSSAGTTSEFQIQVIRNVLEDSLYSFQTELSTAINDLHIEIMRQFEVQKRDIRRMILESSVTDELMEELRELRAENERLRQNY